MKYSIPALTLLLTFVLVCSAHAQQQPTGSMLPVPPLPPIGLPLPHIGLPPIQGGASGKTVAPPRRQDAHRGAGSVHSVRRDGRRRPGPVLPPFGFVAPLVYVGPFYVIDEPATRPTDRASSAPADDERSPSTLRFDIEPRTTLQLYVDGYYMSLVDGADAVELDAGPHRIELRAPEYETLAFNVKLSPRQPVVYRDRLTPRANAAPEPSAARTTAPMPLFVIPGCYAGNVAPDADSLPSGCDRSRLTTLPR